MRVEGTTQARIPWPWTWQPQGGGNRTLVMTADLARALRTESADAIAAHFGIHRRTVTKWRRRLGVPRFNPGTQLRWHQLAPRKLAAARAAKSETTT